MGLLDGKRALVTGGSSGLGAETVRRFRREGAAVVFTGRDAGRCQAVSAETRAGHVLADARSDADTARAIDQAVAELGGLDVLVANAGTGIVAPVVETPVTEFQRIMDVNVTGYLRYAQAAMPHLERSGAGSIVLVSSDAGVIGEAEIGAYSVSKAAVIMLAKMLAIDGGPRGVRSNVVCPGDIAPGMRDMRESGVEDAAVDTGHWPVPPLGRIGRAEDVASAAVFLASDQSAFCSGSVLLVDGGMRAGMRSGGPPVT
jgi:NAD(P)-dependent dehydrogenase (short-subunit alcohol dehydrogenase family)